ncbi:hypothetical protein A9K55_003926 [Cordyceps militaris]|uniref:Uncharacterized protein n=1 Tax=Cordyceps militaris TaxID=73501 RepID=A0A2H4SL95_CORMI|nr:hypothetical protein A9K55_003926 [Cordyceps militaris]
MRLSTVLVAILPAFAAAQSSDSASLTTVTGTSTTTTTMTNTEYVTKTVTLSRVHTTVSTVSSLNSTTAIQPTGGITLPTASSASATPTTLPTTKGPTNAGAALDAGKVVFAGVAGIVIAALL